MKNKERKNIKKKKGRPSPNSRHYRPPLKTSPLNAQPLRFEEELAAQTLAGTNIVVSHNQVRFPFFFFFFTPHHHYSRSMCTMESPLFLGRTSVDPVPL
jgi:hypothetical protein